MFTRMLKYEWKRSAPLFGGLTLGALGLGIVGIIVLRILVGAGDSLFNSEGDDVLTVVLMGSMGSMLMILYMALLAYAAGIYLVGLYRFYKSRYSDEGYLTFTLPVSVHDIFLSSLVNLSIWVAISGVTVFLALAIALIFGPVESGWVNTELLENFDVIFATYADAFDLIGVNAVSIIICIPVLLVSNIAIAMSCITVGAVIAKKLKILVAIGLNYAVSVVTGILMSIGQVIFLIGQMSQDTVQLDGSVWVTMIVYGGLAVGGYFLSTHLMRRKLNLP